MVNFPMVKLTADMKEAFSRMKVFPVATAAKDGTPNVVPLAMVELHTDDTIWITDNFMNKTMSNLRTNPLKNQRLLTSPSIRQGSNPSQWGKKRSHSNVVIFMRSLPCLRLQPVYCLVTQCGDFNPLVDRVPRRKRPPSRQVRLPMRRQPSPSPFHDGHGWHLHAAGADPVRRHHHPPLRHHHAHRLVERHVFVDLQCLADSSGVGIQRMAQLVPPQAQVSTGGCVITSILTEPVSRSALFVFRQNE